MGQPNQSIADEVTEKFRSLLDRAVLVDRLSRTAFWGFLLFGFWVLLVRRLIPEWNGAQPWVMGAMIVGVIALSIQRARKARWQKDDAAAIADQHLGAEGLCLAMYETTSDSWGPWLKARMKHFQWPGPDWSAAFSRLVLPALFACLVVLIPLNRVLEAQPHLSGGRLVDRIQEKLQAMVEQELIPKVQEESITKELEKLRESVERGEFAAADWEAADHLRQKLEDQLKGAVEAMMTAARESHLDERRSLASPDQESKKLSEQMKAALQKLQESGLGATEDMGDREFANQEEMMKALQGLRDGLAGELGEMALADWVDEDLLAELAKVMDGT